MASYLSLSFSLYIEVHMEKERGERIMVVCEFTPRILYYNMGFDCTTQGQIQGENTGHIPPADTRTHNNAHANF